MGQEKIFRRITSKIWHFCCPGATENDEKYFFFFKNNGLNCRKFATHYSMAAGTCGTLLRPGAFQGFAIAPHASEQMQRKREPKKRQKKARLESRALGERQGESLGPSTLLARGIKPGDDDDLQRRYR